MSFIVHASPGMSIQTVIQILKLKVHDGLSDNLQTFIHLLENNQTIPTTPAQQTLYVKNVFSYIQKDYEYWSWNITIMRFQIQLLNTKNIKIKVLAICKLLEHYKVELTGAEKIKEQQYLNKHNLRQKLKQAYSDSL